LAESKKLIKGAIGAKSQIQVKRKGNNYHGHFKRGKDNSGDPPEYRNGTWSRQEGQRIIESQNAKPGRVIHQQLRRRGGGRPRGGAGGTGCNIKTGEREKTRAR